MRCRGRRGKKNDKDMWWAKRNLRGRLRSCVQWNPTDIKPSLASPKIIRIHLVPLRSLNFSTLARPFRYFFCRLHPISNFHFCLIYKEMRALYFVSLALSRPPTTYPQFEYIRSSQWRQRACCMALDTLRPTENSR